MSGEEHPRLQLRHPFQRSKVGSDVSLGIGDHGAAPPQDQVTGEQHPVVCHPEGEVVGCVPRGVQRGHAQLAGTHHIAVAELREASDPRPVSGRQVLGQL